MKNRDGYYALRCSDCGRRIEEIERVGYSDFDGIDAKCRQCAESSDKDAYLFSASIQRFLIGNVV